MKKIVSVMVKYEDGSMKGYNRNAFQKVLQIYLGELLKNNNHLKVMEGK